MNKEASAEALKTYAPLLQPGSGKLRGTSMLTNYFTDTLWLMGKDASNPDTCLDVSDTYYIIGDLKDM